MDDKFKALITNTENVGKLNTSYSRSFDFGSEKISVSLTCMCDQTESMINEAGKLTFLKVVELTNDGFAILEELRKQVQRT